MSESLLMQLKEVADKALNSENVEEGMKHLAKAFALFSQETQRLKSSYTRLQKRFDDVHEELEKTNIQLRKKINDLNTLSNYLNNILNNISQGIIFIDLDGIITTFNPEAQMILEKKQDDVLFKHFSDNFCDEYFGFSIRKNLNLSLSYKQSYIDISIGEKTKKLEISTRFIHDAQKPYRGMIILLKDITKMHKLQVIANRNDRMKELGEMAATVAHEIRNPLGGIRGYASLLYRDLEGSKHLQEMAGYIIEGTKSLERLVNNVLHFSRPIEPKIVSTNISTFVKDICNFVKVDPTFPEEILLEYHIPRDDIFVPIDVDLFHRAILNLIVNAYQAIQNSGKVTVSILKNNNSCMISISDTGIGIDTKDLEDIFSPFFTTKDGGNGLGLSEAYKIIQAHLGNIDVRSIKDIGTTFTINLPLSR